MSVNIIKQAAFNALGTLLYIALIASGLFYAPKIFHTENTPDTVLAPIAILSLFVFSAALTSFLIFGRPILWYLDGKKKEAMMLFIWTLGIFLSITVAAFIFSFGLASR
jgi:hypothetical protein